MFWMRFLKLVFRNQTDVSVNKCSVFRSAAGFTKLDKAKYTIVLEIDYKQFVRMYLLFNYFLKNIFIFIR